MESSSDENKTQPCPGRKPRSLCLPFTNEVEDNRWLADRNQCRIYLMEQYRGSNNLAMCQPHSSAGPAGVARFARRSIF